MNATRHRLPHSTTCRAGMCYDPEYSILTEQYNSGPTNQPGKPPSEGVSLSWRSNHEHSPINTHNQGRALALPLKRVAQRRTTKRLRHTAQLVVRPHNQHRIHDGQEWSVLGHSLPTSQSGQE